MKPIHRPLKALFQHAKKRRRAAALKQLVNTEDITKLQGTLNQYSISQSTIDDLFLQAARENKIKSLAILYETKTISPFIRHTALFYAAVEQHLEASALLLACGADPDKPRSNLLSLSIQNGNVPLATLYLNHGADPARHDHEALKTALYKRNKQAVRLLSSYDENTMPQALRQAAKISDPELLEQLDLKTAGDAACFDALTIAARHNNLAAIATLKNHVGQHALNLAFRAAAAAGHIESLETLKQAGANPRAWNEDALVQAIRHEQAHIVDKFLKTGHSVIAGQGRAVKEMLKVNNPAICHAVFEKLQKEANLPAHRGLLNALHKKAVQYGDKTASARIIKIRDGQTPRRPPAP